jgi:hypothetical protein
VALSEFELKRIAKSVDAFVQRRRPPPHLRPQVDLAFRINGQSVEIFEIRVAWRDKTKTIEEPVAKATYVKTRRVWIIYWQRADMKWHRYQANPVRSIEEFLDIVQIDEFGCFFG